MRHILFIDPLEKLVLKKDSTLMFALSLKEKGESVALLFEKDFYIDNSRTEEFKVYDFEGSFLEDGIYLKDFKLKESSTLLLKAEDIFHMRLDPPFDTRYLRFLWMQDYLEKKGVRVINSPKGVLRFNEKLLAYQYPEMSMESYIGTSVEGFERFVGDLQKKGFQEVILKPLDLYQGYGVERLIVDSHLSSKFEKKVKDLGGAIVAQPFIKEVAQGEVRSLYFQGKELGSILKVPQKGEYLANIAQGAKFSAYDLSKEERSYCEYFCELLAPLGVPWIAFDLLGGKVSEVNITCPGLLVEVSKAYNKNLAFEIVDLI